MLTPLKCEFCLYFKTLQNKFTNPVYETAIQNELRNAIFDTRLRFTHTYKDLNVQKITFNYKSVLPVYGK